MGRYYSGDIEGKFWFAVQSSNAADRFGVIGEQLPVLDYYFSEENLSKINVELDKIEEKLGENLEKFDAFFKKHEFYSYEELSKEVGLPLSVTKSLLREYADYKLGVQIKKCITEKGECCFSAEY